MRNILDFGAVGDGVTVNTKAIQAAIDAGGAVYIPRGVFVTGTLHLKSGGGLYLEEGAVLRAGHDRADYNAADYCPQNQIFQSENMAGTHLISAVEQNDVFVAGFGEIDGDASYWVNESCVQQTTGFFGHPPKEKERPAQMLFFAECKNVRVQDVRLVRSPFWHLFFHGCEDVQVRGLFIKGENRQWVNDGIDIDCCKRVTVSDCIIDTGDDAITLRANGKPLLHSDGICEDVTVSNCVLKSYLDYGIRVGVGEGVIRNCIFSGLIIRDSLRGIGIINRFLDNSKGVSVENLRFQNISIAAHTAFDIKMCNQDGFLPSEELTHTKHVFFDGISAYCDRGSLLVGKENATLSHICFRNVDMHFSGEDPHGDRASCNWRGGIGHSDAAFYMRGVCDVRLDGVRMFFDKDAAFTHDLLTEECEAPMLTNCDLQIEESRGDEGIVN